MFIDVDLWTESGGFVAKVQVPKFDPPPIVLVWGQRFFVRHIDDRYIEGHAYWVPPGHEAAKQSPG